MSPSPVPGQFQNHALVMDMPAMYRLATTDLPADVTDLTTALGTISTSLNSIKLNWAGDSAREMTAILDRWAACATALFGTEKNPEQGVLSRIAEGLAAAVTNYARTDELVGQLWKEYVDLLNSLLNGGGETPAGGDGGGQDSLPISQV